MPHELPDKEKATHAEVAYEHPSEHAGRYCGNCEHLIENAKETRCQTVKGPIYLNGWCKRWDEA